MKIALPILAVVAVLLVGVLGFVFGRGRPPVAPEPSPAAVEPAGANPNASGPADGNPGEASPSDGNRRGPNANAPGTTEPAGANSGTSAEPATTSRPRATTSRPPQPAREPAPRVPPPPPIEPMTAETLVGAEWSFGGASYSFGEDGTLTSGGQTVGTWSIDDAGSVTLQTPGGTRVGAMREGQLSLGDGTAIETK